MRICKLRVRLKTKSYQLKANEASSGFSLIELLVTISIAILVTAVVFFNYPKFKQNVSLRRTSDEIALTIRQAQVYGSGVRRFSRYTLFPWPPHDEEVFPSGYGVYFDITTEALRKQFVLFADAGSVPNLYEGEIFGVCGSTRSECVQKFNITTGDKISKLCSNVKSNPPGSPGNCTRTNLNIVFLRPNPTVNLYTRTGLIGLIGPFSDVSIEIKSIQGDTRTIVVWSTGQISVETL